MSVPTMRLRTQISATFVCAIGLLNAAITQAETNQRLSFELDVMPVLTAAGCNAGACHGKQRGQNGFQLSLLGFDADFDYEAIVHQGRGRRLNPAAPEQSLLLAKAVGAVPHGGGAKLQSESERYQVIHRWIQQGMPRQSDEDPTLVSISVGPPQRVLDRNEQLPLIVEATYSDGSTRDVTGVTAYQSNEPAIVAVDDSGMMTAGELAGEASIMARYMGHIATWNTAITREGEINDRVYDRLARWNFIDDIVWQRLQELNLRPSDAIDDATFQRRVHLDLIGRLPTPDEVREFVADENPDKRLELVDTVLERPEYADHWASKWADLLRPNPYRVGIKATLNLDAWLRKVFRENLSYDVWVQQLVTAQGSTWRNGAATFFRDRRQPEEITTAISQLFLGVRLECAKCHHHPFEVWGQDDFYGLAAYFAQVGRKGTGISPPISGGEEIVFDRSSGEVHHPLTRQVVAPRTLVKSEKTQDMDGSRRTQFAEWLVSNDNPYFARAGANRIWAELMGRGLVDPVDDLRSTNPASNEELLDALAQEFRRVRFDQKEFIRTITRSYVYQLSSVPNETNTADRRNYSRHYRRQMPAEVLLDAVCDATGVPEAFLGDSALGVPPGSRAAEAWTFRLSSQFLDAFGRPDANQDPPCERIGDSTVVQALHMMNAQHLHDKVIHKNGRALQLASSDRSTTEILNELYLSTFSRFPSEEEIQTAKPLFGENAEERQKATEDLLWSLLNSPEFLLQN